MFENGSTDEGVLFYSFKSVAKSEEVVDPIVEVEEEQPRAEGESSDDSDFEGFDESTFCGDGDYDTAIED